MEFLLHHALETAARRHPDRPAVIDGKRAIDYATLERRANALAHLLIDRGMNAGDRIGLNVCEQARQQPAVRVAHEHVRRGDVSVIEQAPEIIDVVARVMHARKLRR